jgi:tetratricopeptide (TPR) repeat protein
MRTIVIASALALVCATPSDSSAARNTRGCPESGAACEADSAHGVVVRRARGAFREGAWNEAADLWTTALLMNDRIAEHWTALATSLTNAGRHREAVAAYQRAIQLDAGTMSDGTWNIARAYALMGNDKQATRWLELALQAGIEGHERQWKDPLFDRYRAGVRLRRLIETGGAPAERGRHTGTRWS